MAKRETKAATVETENEVNQTGQRSEAQEAEGIADDVNGSTSENVGHDEDHDKDDGGYAIEQISVKATRDDFAIAALQGMLANGTHMQRADAVAYKAYEYADAMLAVRGE